jgi:hypothetical protein
MLILASPAWQDPLSVEEVPRLCKERSQVEKSSDEWKRLSKQILRATQQSELHCLGKSFQYPHGGNLKASPEYKDEIFTQLTTRQFKSFEEALKVITKALSLAQTKEQGSRSGNRSNSRSVRRSVRRSGSNNSSNQHNTQQLEAGIVDLDKVEYFDNKDFKPVQQAAAKMVEQYVAPDFAYQKGSKCQGQAQDVHYINAGASAMGLKFGCHNGLAFAVKVFVNPAEAYDSGDTKGFIDVIKKEYENVTRVIHKNVMQGYGIFVISGKQTRRVLTIKYKNDDLEQQKFHIPKEKLTFYRMDDPKVPRQLTNTGGVILEYVPYSFEESAGLRMIDKLRLLQGYVEGLIAIRKAGLLHGDIKPPNMRFTKLLQDGKNVVQAKIIDLDYQDLRAPMLNLLSQDWQDPLSVEEVPRLCKERSQVKKSSDDWNRLSEQILRATQQSELHCLGKSFQYPHGGNLKASPEYKDKIFTQLTTREFESFEEALEVITKALSLAQTKEQGSRSGSRSNSRSGSRSGNLSNSRSGSRSGGRFSGRVSGRVSGRGGVRVYNK